MKVFYDNIIFYLQRYGGVSRCFTEINDLRFDLRIKGKTWKHVAISV